MDEDEQVDALAEYYETRIGKLKGLRPVNVRVARQPRHVFSLRIGAEELDTIADAAERRGVSVGDFIRQAALQAALEGENGSPAQRMEEKLDEILARLRP